MSGRTRWTMVFLVLMVATTPVETLEVRDIVHLTDGSQVHGAVVERIPGVSYTVETERGDLVTLPVARVDRIEKISVETSDVPFSYQDVVLLRSGLIFRGTIVEEAPGQHIILLVDGGLPIQFGQDAIWRISSEKCVAGQSRAALGEHPTGADLRRKFQIELTISRIESAERGESGGSVAGLDRLRADLAELEAEEQEAADVLQEGEESIARVLTQLSDLQIDASTLASELARRALVCPEADQDSVLAAFEVVQSHLDTLRTTATAHTQVDPRMLSEQVALEQNLRRVELASLLTVPLPIGSIDPSVENLVPIFSHDERQELYDELRMRPVSRPFMLNLVLPVGAGSFGQGDHLGGTIAAVSVLSGLVLFLDSMVYAGEHSEEIGYTTPTRTWVGIGLVLGGYLYSLSAPRSFLNRQNQRLEDVLRLDEVVEGEE